MTSEPPKSSPPINSASHVSSFVYSPLFRRERAGLISQFHYSWLRPLLLTSLNRRKEHHKQSRLKKANNILLPLSNVPCHLSDADIGQIPHIFTSNASYLRFLESGNKSPRKSSLSKKDLINILHDHTAKKSIFSTKFTAFCLGSMVKKELIISGIFKAISELSLLVLPLLLYYFLIELENLSGTWQNDNRLTISIYNMDILFTPQLTAYLLGVAILIVSSISSYTSKRSLEILRYAGTSIQTALSLSIYKKLFRLAPHTKSTFTNGRVFALVTGDVRRIDLSMEHIHVAWLGILQIILISGLLFWILGPGAGAGLLLTIGSVPIQYFVVKYLAKKRNQATSLTDSRIRFVDQLLFGIRIVAFNDWGEAFCNFAHKLRSAELAAQLSLHILIALLITLMNATPIMASLVAFAATNYISDTPISTSTIFAALAMFAQLRSAMGTFPPFLSKIIDAKISLRRISELLRADELAFFSQYDRSIEYNSSSDHPNAESKLFYINIQNLWASWSNSKPFSSIASKSSKEVISKEPSILSLHILKALCSLKEITISIPTGACVVIVGPVGSGKSSLLQCILGEMSVVCGNLEFLDNRSSLPTFAYCPQIPWIKHGSLRENIIFGSLFNTSRYSAVLSVCKLRTDIKHLPLGDLTEIGGSPSPLSGGQRQRVALARALYASFDILILDDPISALDAKVAKAVWTNAISNTSQLLKGKTRIIATHSLHLIPNSCDWVIQMDQGSIKWQGPPSEWNQSSELPDQEITPSSKEQSNLCPQSPFAISSMKTIHRFPSAIALDNTPVSTFLPNEPFIDDVGSIQDTESIFADELMELGALESSEASRKGSRLVAIAGYDQDTPGIGVQQGLTGSLPIALYFGLLKRFGWFLFSLTITFLFILQWARIATERELAQNGSIFLGNSTWLLAFFFIGSTAIFTTLISTGVWRAARSIYSEAFSMVTNAPLSFFDHFPLGQLLNRLTMDTERSDYDVLDAGRDLLGKTCAVGSVLVLVAITMPGILGITLPIVLALANWLVLRLYHTPMLDLERLSSRARSAYLQQIGDSLTGLQVIRAFGIRDDNASKLVEGLTPAYSPMVLAYKANCKRLDRFLGPVLLLASLQSWASLYFELIANCCVAATALFCVWANVSPIVAGLVIHQLMSLAKSIYTSIVSFADLELALCSVQRLQELSSLDEDFLIDKNNGTHDEQQQSIKSIIRPRPSSSLSIPDMSTWPAEGCIEFQSVTVRYAPQSRPVLCDISLEVVPGERLAIIGRTGSGKSTLIQALFGLIPLAEGSIKIDDVDISMIPGSLLRQRLAIIPQDPVIFYGTSLRFNLDPMGVYSDAAIWESLETASVASHLKQVLIGTHSKQMSSGTSDALNVILREGTAILSQGQSQLVCLARALLKKSRILVLDEATANVDTDMDALIQKTIKKVSSSSSSNNNGASLGDAFSCTVITIAHRLLSILDYDRIVVLQDGFISEIGTPTSLISNENSLFTQLVKELGEAEYSHVCSLLLRKE